MDKEFYKYLGNQLKKRSQIIFSFYAVTKGFDFTYDIKGINDNDFKYIEDGCSEWFYDYLIEMLCNTNSYFDEGKIEFFVHDDDLCYEGTFESSDTSHDVDWPKNYQGEIVSENILKTISNSLGVDIDEIDEELFSFDIEINIDYTSNSREVFDVFDVFYNSEKIILSKDQCKLIKEEVYTIMCTWDGTYSGDMELSKTKIISYSDEDIFHCTDIISFSEAIKIKDE